VTDDYDDTPWLSPSDRRVVLNLVLKAREKVERLERAQSKRHDSNDPDLSTDVRWFLWRQQVRRASARAELEAWQAVHRQVEAWQDAAASARDANRRLLDFAHDQAAMKGHQ
jgi:hypothetical protein